MKAVFRLSLSADGWIFSFSFDVLVDLERLLRHVRMPICGPLFGWPSNVANIANNFFKKNDNSAACSSAFASIGRNFH